MIKQILWILLPFLCACSMQAPERQEILLESGWRFTKGDPAGAEQPAFDDQQWQEVTVPHDWAIYGPFDRANDLQEVAELRDHSHRENRTYWRLALRRSGLVPASVRRDRV